MDVFGVKGTVCEKRHSDSEKKQIFFGEREEKKKIEECFCFITPPLSSLPLLKTSFMKRPKMFKV